MAYLSEKKVLNELKGLIMRMPFGCIDLKVLNTALICNESIQFEHSHNCSEVYLLVEGDAVFNIDGQQVKLKEGQICWINPFVTRYAENDPLVDQKQFIVMFDFIPKAKEDKVLQMHQTLVLQMLSENICNKPFWVEQDLNGCMDNFHSICNEMADRKFGYLLKAQNFLSSFIISAVQNLHLPNSPLLTSPECFGDLATALISYIRNHYAEDISLEIAAKELNISPRHISRTMKDSLNTTFKRTLESYRIEHVKYYLCRTELSIEKIAEKVGFSSPNVLFNNFKKITGLSITEYKQRSISSKK